MSKAVIQSVTRDKEGQAGEALKPCTLVDASVRSNVVKHGTLGAKTPVAVVLERDWVGQGVEDTTIPSGDNFKWRVFRTGEEVLMLLKAGESVAEGASLESAGNGELQAVSTGTALVQARETIDNSTGTDATFIKVEVL